MKMLKLAALSLAVFLYSSVALAQHGHGGGMGMGNSGMGNSMGHGSGNASSHGNRNAPPTSTQKISDVLSKNPAIGDKIVALTNDKMGAADACQGFKNIGQCIAAAHVSKNLPGMNFFCLRQAMTKTPAGTNAPSTGCSVTGSFSLGKAIQKLDPQADSTTETKKANTESQQDMKSSGVKS